MKFTFSNFMELSEDDKYIVWLGLATLLTEREEAEFTYALYQLENFYIEMKFCKSNPEHSVMRTFSNTASLEPYLDFIDISTAIPE